MSKPAMNNTAALAEYLVGVLNGTRSLQFLLNDPGDLVDTLRPCFHGLHHYLADDRLRQSDETYREMQDAEMKKLIQLLQSGASDEKLRSITFLGKSP